MEPNDILKQYYDHNYIIGRDRFIRNLSLEDLYTFKDEIISNNTGNVLSWLINEITLIDSVIKIKVTELREEKINELLGM